MDRKGDKAHVSDSREPTFKAVSRIVEKSATLGLREDIVGTLYTKYSGSIVVVVKSRS